MTAQPYQLSKPAPDDGPAETIGYLYREDGVYVLSYRQPHELRRWFLSAPTMAEVTALFRKAVPGGKVVKARGVS